PPAERPLAARALPPAEPPRSWAKRPGPYPEGLDLRPRPSPPPVLAGLEPPKQCRPAEDPSRPARLAPFAVDRQRRVFRSLALREASTLAQAAAPGPPPAGPAPPHRSFPLLLSAGPRSSPRATGPRSPSACRFRLAPAPPQSPKAEGEKTSTPF